MHIYVYILQKCLLSGRLRKLLSTETKHTHTHFVESCIVFVSFRTSSNKYTYIYIFFSSKKISLQQPYLIERFNNNKTKQIKTSERVKENKTKQKRREIVLDDTLQLSNRPCEYLNK